MKTHHNLVIVILFCVVLPGILGRFQYEARRRFQRFPTKQRLQHRRFEPTSRLTSRPAMFRQRVRSLPKLLQPRGDQTRQAHRQDIYPTEPKWFNRSPFRSEVSVPSVRRTPIPKGDTLRQLRGNLMRERKNTPVIGVGDKPERQGSVLPRVRQILRPSRLINNENNEQNEFSFSQNLRRNTLNSPRMFYGPVKPLVGQPSIGQTQGGFRPSSPRQVLPLRRKVEKQQVLPKVVRRQRVSSFHDPVLVRPISYQSNNFRLPSQPLVSLRSLPGINKIARGPKQSLSIQTKPMHRTRDGFASSDIDSTSYSFKTHISSKSNPVTILHTQPELIEKRQSQVAELQTIPETTMNQDSVSVIHSNPSNTVVQTKPLVRSIQTNPDYTLSTSHQKQITKSSPNIALMQPKPVNTVVQTNPGISIGMVEHGVHIQEPNNVISPGTAHSSVLSSGIQTDASPPASSLHADLVDAFTNVIESLLVPQMSGGLKATSGQVLTNNKMNNANEPLNQPTANANIPQQIVQGHLHTPDINQFAPHHMQGSPMMGSPYNRFGYMQNFGYMNPWMSSAAMQEMMFGDTTDPPDIITATALPTNISATNSTVNETVTTIALDSNVTLPLVNQDNLSAEVKIGIGMGNVLVTTIEPLIKPKETSVNVEASVDITSEKNILSMENTPQLVEKNVEATVDVTTENGRTANENIETVQKLVVDSGPSNIDANIEIKPTNTIKINLALDAKNNKTTNVHTVKTEKIKPFRKNVKVKSKGIIENLSKPVTKDEMRPLNSISKMGFLNTDTNIKNNAKHVHRDGIDVITKSTLPKDKNDTSLNATMVKKNDIAAQNTKQGVSYAIPHTRTDKAIDKNEKLILDIASLIRKSKLDLGKLSSIVSGSTGKIEKVNMKPIPERYPTAKQLGIKLTLPAKRKRPKNKIRPTKSLTKYTIIPQKTQTLPPVPKAEDETNTTMPTLIPKGLVFTRQPEIYRTLRTILKYNPDAVKKAITTDPTPTHGLTKATEGPGIENLVENSKDGSSPALVSILTKLTKPSTVKATKPTTEVPVLSNVVDHKVEQKLIPEETIVINKAEEIKKEKTTSDTGNILHKKLLDLNLTKDDSGIARYLQDPAFVSLLKGILKSMASKPEGTTSEYYYHEPETTTNYPEFTTTSEPPTTTEEYEAEDYITEAP